MTLGSVRFDVHTGVVRRVVPVLAYFEGYPPRPGETLSEYLSRVKPLVMGEPRRWWQFWRPS